VGNYEKQKIKGWRGINSHGGTEPIVEEEMKRKEKL